MENNTILEIKDLVVNYNTDKGIARAVNGLDLVVKKGETLGLVGETGAGKTTTALSVMGLVPDPPGVIENGEIYFDGQNLLKMKEQDIMHIRGNRISMIFQDPMTSLNPVLTVGEQIYETIKLHQKLDRKEAIKRTEEMLELVGIPKERKTDYPHQFSGGMKQRVGIAIALSCNPELILADEPTTALDVTIQAQVLELMRKLKEKLNTAMVLITHDLGVVAETCDSCAIMYAGKIIEYSTVEKIFTKPLHPYTVGLFNSIPSLDEDYDRLNPINGLMPDPVDLPKGCKFNPRCPYATEECREKEPEYTEYEAGHFVACLNIKKESDLGGEDCGK